MADYIIKHADGTLHTVADSTTNVDYSLGLVGDNSINFGQTFAQNFLQLLSNFAANTAPNTNIYVNHPSPAAKSAVKGQLWYDTSKNIMKFYDGTIWTAITSNLSSVQTFVPISTGTVDAGSALLRWKKIYTNAIDIDNQNAAGVNIIGGAAMKVFGDIEMNSRFTDPDSLKKISRILPGPGTAACIGSEFLPFGNVYTKSLTFGPAAGTGVLPYSIGLDGNTNIAIPTRAGQHWGYRASHFASVAAETAYVTKLSSFTPQPTIPGDFTAAKYVNPGITITGDLKFASRLVDNQALNKSGANITYSALDTRTKFNIGDFVTATRASIGTITADTLVVDTIIPMSKTDGTVTSTSLKIEADTTIQGHLNLTANGNTKSNLVVSGNITVKNAFIAPQGTAVGFIYESTSKALRHRLVAKDTTTLEIQSSMYTASEDDVYIDAKGNAAKIEFDTGPNITQTGPDRAGRRGIHFRVAHEGDKAKDKITWNSTIRLLNDRVQIYAGTTEETDVDGVFAPTNGIIIDKPNKKTTITGDVQITGKLTVTSQLVEVSEWPGGDLILNNTSSLKIRGKDQATTDTDQVRSVITVNSAGNSGAPGNLVLGNNTNPLVLRTDANDPKNIWFEHGESSGGSQRYHWSMLNLVYPVGTIFETTATGNPTTLLHWGARNGNHGCTWVAFGQGRVLVGSGYDESSELFERSTTIGDITYTTDETNGVRNVVYVSGLTLSASYSSPTLTITLPATGSTASDMINAVNYEASGVISAILSGAGPTLQLPALAPTAIKVGTFSVNDTGGAYKHQLTIDEMPSHDHDYTAVQQVDSDVEYEIDDGNSFKMASVLRATELTGDDLPHENMPPYVVVHRWRRTA